MKHPPRHLAWKRLERGLNGRGLCRWCSREVEPPRRTFCSGRPARVTRGGAVREPGGGCVHEWMIRRDPGYARLQVLARDQRRCWICGEVDLRWEMDHILPVAEGGGSCGLSNLRTLCRVHHLLVTRELRARLAVRRGMEGV